MKELRRYPGYYATKSGKIYSKKGRKKRLLKPAISNKGYLRVCLMVSGKKLNRTVHSLIAEAFYGPLPDGYQLMHLNENKLDNRAVNLRKGTQSENTLRYYRYKRRLAA